MRGRGKISIREGRGGRRRERGSKGRTQEEEEAWGVHLMGKRSCGFVAPKYTVTAPAPGGDEEQSRRETAEGRGGGSMRRDKVGGESGEGKRGEVWGRRRDK
eukprot:747223-Hanusia_phi.AAC.1